MQEPVEIHATGLSNLEKQNQLVILETFGDFMAIPITEASIFLLNEHLLQRPEDLPRHHLLWQRTVYGILLLLLRLLSHVHGHRVTECLLVKDAT